MSTKQKQLQQINRNKNERREEAILESESQMANIWKSAYPH